MIRRILATLLGVAAAVVLLRAAIGVARTLSGDFADVGSPGSMLWTQGDAN